jgi:hypothetical protein
MRLGLALLFAGAVLAATPSDAFAQKKQRDVITAEEIEKSGQKDLDLLSAIKALRPHFLEMPRGNRTMGNSYFFPITVVVDGRRGDAEALSQLRAIDVKEVRYLDANKSQNEYGANANSGAIVVKMMRVDKKEK